MTFSSYEDLLRRAEAVAARAASTLVDMQGRKLDVARKERRDVVTEADLASEKIVIEGLRALTPDAAILAEESGFSGLESAPRWIIDPLDGTVNFAGGLPWFSVTIAYQESGSTKVGVLNAPRAGVMGRYAEGSIATINGEPARVSGVSSLADAIVSVIITSHFNEAEVARASEAIRRLGEVARGVRIIVSGGLEMCWVACGQLDAYISLKADAVSHAAAMPIVRAAGGRITRLDGSEANDDHLDRITSNGLVHDELLELLSRL